MSGRYGLSVQTPGAGDLPGLAALLRAGAGLPVTPARLGARIEAIRAEGGAVLIAAEWGPPSGVVSLHRTRTLVLDEPAGRVGFLLVDPEARRRGIGRVLLKAAAQAARASGCVTLDIAVPPGADTLDAFCRANGFVLAGTTWSRGLRKGG